MRYMFGLVSLLVVVAIIAYMMSMQSSSLKTAAHTRDETKKMAGYDEDGTRAMDTITLDTADAGGKTVAILVADIKKDGAFERHFGLKKGDKITEIGGQRVRDINDGELAKAMVQESYQRNQQLVVERNGKKLTLPRPGGETASGTESTDQPSKKKTDVQSQLDAIQKIPTH